MKLLRTLLSVGLAVSLCSAEMGETKPNVLFIAVDDLNDWIGCMGGHPQAITPNMDQLATEGMLFLNNHSQAPVCGPSRSSLLTGLYPHSSGIYLNTKDREMKTGVTQKMLDNIYLPDWFEQNGYKSIGAGKIFHGGGMDVFDEYGERGNFGPKPKRKFNFEASETGFPEGTGTDWAAYPDVDEKMPDFITASFGVEKLNEKHDKPFFLALGFFRPHVPWYAPQKWFDMHPLESIQTPAYLPNDLDDVPEMGKYVTAVPEMPTTEWAIENDQWKPIVQAYLACSTFVDAQVGKVLDALRESEYADNTIVVLWSDHGYHLGEKNRFAKQAIWERDTRTVFMLKVPGMDSNRKCEAITGLIDIYPTLLELCGIPANTQNEGRSLVPLLNNPKADWERMILTAWGPDNFSLRDDTFRYIVYEDGSEELYDMINDPNEWTNLASEERYTEKIRLFKKQIPENPAPNARTRKYTGNEYWIAKTSGKGAGGKKSKTLSQAVQPN